MGKLNILKKRAHNEYSESTSETARRVRIKTEDDKSKSPPIQNPELSINIAITQQGLEYLVHKEADGTLSRQNIKHEDGGYIPDTEAPLDKQIKLLFHFLKDIPPSKDEAINANEVHNQALWDLQRGYELIIPEKYARSLATDKYKACLPEDGILVFEKLSLDQQKEHLGFLQNISKLEGKEHLLVLLNLFEDLQAPKGAKKGYKSLLRNVKNKIKAQ